MSEPTLISPLLDGFILGNPMSNHHGVLCCPAIKENSDKKYIVKIISIPASQVQLDALLLAGAYKDSADAMEYFKTLADDVAEEADSLRKLAKLGGFLPYEGWQIEPITRHRLGYQVYLVSSYKRSLDKHMRRSSVTHLEAVNLGLDICSALTAARNSGLMYVDLKPSNIFISGEKEFRIGDLGFVRMASLKYTSLPGKYRSVYAAPELHDPMNTINETADTYALGMILYQLYNDGQIPFRGTAPEEGLPSPIHADYEIAEIIMKAIDPDPEKRWADPQSMGKALVDYMQRNSINDVPITPVLPIHEEPSQEPVQQEAAEPSPEEETSSLLEQPEQEPAAMDQEPASGTPAEEDFEAGLIQDETAPDTDTAEVLHDYEMSEELTQIVTQADDLIAHQPPTEIQVAEAISSDPFDFIEEDDIAEEEVLPPVAESFETAFKPKPKKKTSVKRTIRTVLNTLLVMILLGALAFGGFWFYQNYYLQNISSLTVEGSQKELTVTVDTNADLSLLSVICTDNYGNAQVMGLTNGTAVFTDLLPDSLYRIHVEIDGFHKLTGKTSDIFTTDAITTIVSISAITGPEDGSIMLNFTATGGEPAEWIVTYSAEGEEERQKSFTGHSVTLTGLTIGKVYTFELSSTGEMSTSGEDSIRYSALPLILAENLTVTSSTGTDITIHWEAPGDVVVESWDVRCYNEKGHEQQLTVPNTQVYFDGIDPTQSYTVEVTAAGMTQPARTTISANPILITNFAVDESDPEQLTVTWDTAGATPEGGWLLLYSIDGGKQNVIKCEDPAAVIYPRIPEAGYTFEIQSTDGTSVFGGSQKYNCPNAAVFNENGLKADNISAKLLVTPEEEGWNEAALNQNVYTDTFASGDPISIVLFGNNNFYTPVMDTNILFVIRDSYGNVLPDLVSQLQVDWKELWVPGNYHYAEIDIPKVPTEPGKYSLALYFNGDAVLIITFTIT